MARKVLIPFMNFVLNQKARMYSDVLAVTSKTSSKEDKVAAARSLAGLAVETATFHGLSIAISAAIFDVAASLMGYEEDEEAKERRLANLRKGRATSVFTDLVSPLPIVDSAILGAANVLLDKFQADIPEDEKFQFFNKTDKTLYESLGVLGIAIQKLGDFSQIAEMAFDGTITTEYMGKKRTKNIDSETQEMIRNLVLPTALMYNLGLMPAEVGSALRYVTKAANKMAKTDKQLEKESGSSRRGRRRSSTRGRSSTRRRSSTRSRRRSRGRSRR